MSEWVVSNTGSPPKRDFGGGGYWVWQMLVSHCWETFVGGDGKQ